MFQFSVTATATVSLFNRAYSKGKIDVKNLTFKMNHVDSTPIDLTILGKQLNSAISLIDDRIVIQHDDPYLIHLLEPKTGNTVHNMLNEIRAMEKAYTLLGDTLPPDTINAYKITVLNSNIYTATMEGLAKFVFDQLSDGYDRSLSVSDSTYSVEI